MAEQKSKKFDPVTVFGVVLAVAIMIGGQLYFAEQNRKYREAHPQPAPVAANETPKAENGGTTAATGTSEAKVSSATPKAQPETPAGDAEPAKAPDITVDNGLVSVVFTAEGASIKNADLPTEFIDPVKKDKQGLELLTEIEPGKTAFSLPELEIGPSDLKERQRFDAASGTLKALSQRVWNLEKDSGSFEGGKRTVEYSTTLGGKYKLSKIYTIQKEQRYVELALKVTNLSDTPVSYSYKIVGVPGLLLDGPKENPKANAFVALRAEIAGRETAPNGAQPSEPDVLRVDPATAAKAGATNSKSEQENLWGTVKNRFYMAMLISQNPTQLIRISAVEIKHATTSDDKRLTEPNVGIVGTRAESNLLKKGESQEDFYALYIGPANEEQLATTAESLKLQNLYLTDAIQYCDIFGWRWPRVDWIARRMMWIFKGLSSVMGSYGIAVILLTLLIKLALHPVQRKMMVSMNKMQKLQPELKKITEKYKNQTSMESKQRMWQEQQDVMKKAGASPAGGCLPMFIQIPVLSALYGIFSHAFEIRGAQFLWVRDLSQPDMLSTLPFWPHVLNLLPILYLGLQLLQMKFAPQAPPSDDPAAEMNRKMMGYMPVFLTFMFYSMPSGLMIYFAASAVFSIIESWYIRKFLIPPDNGAPGSPASNRPPPAIVPSPAGGSR